MRLPEFTAQTGVKLRAISEESEVSYATIKAVNSGKLMDSYKKASAVSEATRKLSPLPGVFVRIEDLCEPVSG